jgi:hypothetical protein
MTTYTDDYTLRIRASDNIQVRVDFTNGGQTESFQVSGGQAADVLREYIKLLDYYTEVMEDPRADRMSYDQ